MEKVFPVPICLSMSAVLITGVAIGQRWGKCGRGDRTEKSPNGVR